MASIEEHKQLITELCIEMSITRSELKLRKPKSMLDEDEILRAECNSLEAEKHKRLDEYNKQVVVENELSRKLRIDPVEKRQTVPSQKMLNELSSRICAFKKLVEERTRAMATMKEDIVKLSEDLELSRSDSFAELIIMEPIDEMPLGEDDLKREYSFRIN